MKASTRGEYGLRAMVAFAHSYGQGAKSIAAVSKETSIPAPYLEQLIGPLKQAGLVDAKRGAHGGYALSRNPSEITVGAVYRAMEGPVAPMECVSENVAEQDCPFIPNCETRPVWLSVRDAIATTLDNMTLGDLISGKKKGPIVGIQIAETSDTALIS